MNKADSNADACCLGNNFVILKHATKQVDVHTCNESVKPLNAPIVSGAAAWDDLVTNQACVLITNQAPHHGTKLDHLPINPNQIWNFGIHHWDNPFDKDQGLSIGPVDLGLQMPLSTDRTEIQLMSQAPTPNELL